MGDISPVRITAREADAFRETGIGQDAIVIDPTAAHDSILRGGTIYSEAETAYFRGLVTQSYVLLQESYENSDATKSARLERYPNAAYMNELAPFFGLRPGVDTFKLVNCEGGGLIPPYKYVKHIAAKEAPLSTNDINYVKHDRVIDDHIVGWWSLPGKFVNDLAAVAKKRIDTYDANPSTTNLNKIKALAGAVDDVSSIDYAGIDTGIPDMLSEKNDALKAFLARAGVKPQSIIWMTDAVREVYFDGRHGPLTTASVGLKTTRLYHQRYQNAAELMALAEHARPDFSISPVRHMGKKALRWATAHLPA